MVYIYSSLAELGTHSALMCVCSGEAGGSDYAIAHRTTAGPRCYKQLLPTVALDPIDDYIGLFWFLTNRPSVVRSPEINIPLFDA